MRAAIVIVAGLLAGCAGDVASSPSAEARPEPAGAEPPRARPRAPVRSCATDVSPREVAATLDPRIDIGVVGEASWLFGYENFEARLIGLGATGELQLTPVPLQNAQAAATLGDKIYFYAPREAGPEAPARWMVVDVSEPDAPRVGPVVPLGLAGQFSYASTLAVGRRRAVIVVGLPDELALATIDTATGATVGEPVTLATGMLPIKAFCADDRCAVVAIRDEGGGPTRRLVVLRVAADGKMSDELVAPDWIGRVHVAEVGDRVFVQWDGHEGLRVRALDRAGQPLGPARGPHAGPSRRFHAGELLSGFGPPMLAIGERGRWSIAALAADAMTGPERVLDGAVHYSLIGTTLDDGLAWASISGDVSYDEIGEGTFTHSWRMKIAAGFIGDDGSAGHAEIMSESGAGRGGYGVWMLARPGRAAVLMAPQGDAQHFAGKARLVPLRAPCPAR